MKYLSVFLEILLLAYFLHTVTTCHGWDVVPVHSVTQWGHVDSVCECEAAGKGRSVCGPHVLCTSKVVSVGAESWGCRNLQTGSVVKVSVSLTHLLLLPVCPRGEGKSHREFKRDLQPQIEALPEAGVITTRFTCAILCPMWFHLKAV